MGNLKTLLLMKIKRREFLKTSALGLSGVLTGCRLGAAESAKPTYYDPYEKVALGKTGIKVSRVCIGTGMRGGNRESNQTRMAKEKFERRAATPQIFPYSYLFLSDVQCHLGSILFS